MASLPDTYSRFVTRERHQARLEGGVRALDRLVISRLVRGGAFSVQTPGFDSHFLCVPFAPGARLVFTQEGGTQEGTLAPGQMTLLPAGRPAQWVAETPPQVDTINISLQPSLLAEILGRDAVELRRMPWFFDTHIERLAALIAEEVSAGCPTGDLFLESLIRPLALRIAWVSSHATLHKGRIKPGRAEARRVVEALRADLCANHSLKSLAALTCLSPHQLNRVFKNETGQSVHSYLVRLRVEKAASLLRSGTVPVAEVAAACGFYDESHLSRHVKRLLGRTPRAVRET